MLQMKSYRYCSNSQHLEQSWQSYGIHTVMLHCTRRRPGNGAAWGYVYMDGPIQWQAWWPAVVSEVGTLNIITPFTALHALHATRPIRKKAVRPSVCLSNAWFVKKTKESCAHILIPHDRTFVLVLETKRMVGRGDPFYLKFWVSVT